MEFIVGLDGRKLPAQARKIGDEIARSGTDAGDKFSDNFDSAATRRLSVAGRRMADRLGSQGKLAGNSFASDFGGEVTSKFRQTQRELARILSDKDAFRDYVRGFDDTSHAVTQLNSDLNHLIGKQYEWEDANGVTRKSMVLGRGDLTKYRYEIGRLAAEIVPLVENERALAAKQEDMRANWVRLGRTIADNDVFAEMAEKVGGTDRAFTKYRKQIDELGSAMGLNRVEIETYIDRLESTRIAVDKNIDRMEKLRLEAEKHPHVWERVGKFMAKPWTSLDNDVRLVIGLIASAADQVAVLGSALGAGLIGVGGAASQAIIGWGAFVAVIKTLGEEAENLPPVMRGVAGEVKGLKDAWGDLRKEVAAGAFAEMEGSFSSLEGSLRALYPQFRLVGRSVGEMIDGLADGLAPGTRNLRELQTLVRNSAGAWTSLTESVGTLGAGLVVAFNESQPLIEDLYGWIDRLANRFDRFARSDDMGRWVENSQRVWGAFGNLLDEVGTTLNELSTPASLERTVDLLDNLTRLVGPLGEVLDMIGRFDLVGVVVSGLADLLEEVSPLTDALGTLGDAFRDIALNALPGFASVAGGIATAISPLVEALGQLLGAVPPEVWYGVAQGVAAYIAAMAGLKAITALSAGFGALATKLEGLVGASGKLGAAGAGASKFSTALGKLANTAGGIGIAAVVMVEVVQGVRDLSRQLLDMDNVMNQNVQTGESFNSIYADANATILGIPPVMGDLGDALDRIDGKTGFVNDAWNTLMSGMGETGATTKGIQVALGEIDKPLANMANQSLPKAADQFKQYATQLGASRGDMMNMIGEMPAFEEALKAQAENAGLATDRASLLALVLGEVGPAAALAESPTRLTADQIKRVGDVSTWSKDSLEGLGDAMRTWNDDVFESRDAARQFAEQMEGLNDAIDEDTVKLTDNKTAIDISNEAGREAEEVIDNFAQATMDAVGALIEQGAEHDVVKGKLEEGRQKLYEQMRQLGLSEDAAWAYVDQLLKTPEDLETEVRLTKVEEVKAQIAAMTEKDYVIYIRTQLESAPLGNRTTPYKPGEFAFGGAVYGPGTATSDSIPARLSRGEHVLTAKEVKLMGGQQAVYEFRRALNGGRLPAGGEGAYATGGAVRGGGAGVYIAEGAIVVREAYDARATAYEVLDLVAERVMG